MSTRIEMLLWAPSRAVFAATLAGLTLPDGRHIARLAPEDEPGVAGASIIPIDAIRCDEIGEIVRTPAVLDESGAAIEPAVTIPGWHVNVVATGWLADMLTAGMPATGDIFARTRILALLGATDWQPSAVGEPAGFVGTSGVKIFDPGSVGQRAREWALAGL